MYLVWFIRYKNVAGKYRIIINLFIEITIFNNHKNALFWKDYINIKFCKYDILCHWNGFYGDYDIIYV